MLRFPSDSAFVSKRLVVHPLLPPQKPIGLGIWSVRGFAVGLGEEACTLVRKSQIRLRFLREAIPRVLPFEHCHPSRRLTLFLILLVLR